MSEWWIGGFGLFVGIVLGAVSAALVLLVRTGRAGAALANARGRAELLEARERQQQEEIEALREGAERLRTGREDAEQRVTVLEEQARARERHLQEQRELLDDARGKLGDAFTALGAKALRANNEQFLDLARKTFEGLMTEARGDVDKRRQAIDALVGPIRELLEKHATAVRDLERKREVAYRGMEEQIRGIARSHDKLNTETHRLVSALRRPEQRGRWGEMQLRNVVELAGMTPHCDFDEQPPTDDPATRDRPDMIVRMPGGGTIVVDAKVALDAYLDAQAPDADRDALRRRHADLVEKHYRSLATKRYWEQFDHTPKLVVMFMPLESALVSALEVKPALHADAMESHVLIATPTLLVALLRAVAYGWQQESIAANAREIAGIGGELYQRVAVFAEHFEEIGMRITRATEAYNKAVGSLQSRILPSARRLRELHATTHPEIEPPAPIEIETRAITADELRS